MLKIGANLPVHALQNDPGQSPSLQRLCYTAYRCFGHCLAFCAVCGPDGIVYYFPGPVPGRRHDTTLAARFRINDKLRISQLGLLIQYKQITDKAFLRDTHTDPMFRGPGLTALQDLANSYVAPLRTVLVENVFAGLLNLWGKLSKKRVMQLKKKQVAKTIRVAVLLMNARTCLYGSQTSTYFNCPRPSLQEYFHDP